MTKLPVPRSMKQATAGATTIWDFRMKILSSKPLNLILALSLWASRDEPAIREYLKIPETEIIVAVIAVGYPAAEPSMPKRKAVEEIATFL